MHQTVHGLLIDLGPLPVAVEPSWSRMSMTSQGWWRRPALRRPDCGSQPHETHGALVGRWMRSSVEYVVVAGPIYTAEEQAALTRSLPNEAQPNGGPGQLTAGHSQVCRCRPA